MVMTHSQLLFPLSICLELKSLTEVIIVTHSQNLFLLGNLKLKSFDSYIVHPSIMLEVITLAMALQATTIVLAFLKVKVMNVVFELHSMAVAIATLQNIDVPSIAINIHLMDLCLQNLNLLCM